MRSWGGKGIGARFLVHRKLLPKKIPASSMNEARVSKDQWKIKLVVGRVVGKTIRVVKAASGGYLTPCTQLRS